MGNVQKKGRTLSVTINELMASKRLELAVANFKHDKMLLRALLVELGLECLNVAKNTITRIVAKSYGKGYPDETGEKLRAKGLDAFELIPYLRNCVDIDDFNTFNLYFSLTPLEQKLYAADPKFKLTEEKRKELLDRLKAQFGME